MNYCRCTRAEAAGITQDPWHTQPHPQPATLVTIDSDPFVGETPVAAIQSWVTPNALYYARNHFENPSIEPADWSLIIDGEVDNPSALSLSDIRALPPRTIPVTMECAGNNRVDLDPPVTGNQFRGGAVSTAIWTGVALRDVLAAATPTDAAVEALFVGTDSGEPVPGRGRMAYERSLPLDVAMDPDTLLAYEMNDEPLPDDHGHPLRLVVPRWYGMASVKWLTRIALLSRPFEGFFQSERYVIPGRNGASEPLTRMFVKSLISQPRHGEVHSVGRLRVGGLAWSGEAPIAGVELSDDGDTWRLAQLGGLSHRHAWRQWRVDWESSAPGHHTLIARARDEAGNRQPMENAWTPLGYAVNGVQSACVNIR